MGDIFIWGAFTRVAGVGVNGTTNDLSVELNG
jgi:hypothetical protein